RRAGTVRRRVGPLFARDARPADARGPLHPRRRRAGQRRLVNSHSYITRFATLRRSVCAYASAKRREPRGTIMRFHASFCLLLVFPAFAPAQVVVDFEDLVVPPAGYYNGSDGAGGFTSRGARFHTSYNPAFGSWPGWP